MLRRMRDSRWASIPSREAMLRGVNGIPGALAAEVSDEKVNVRGFLLSLFRLILINPQKEVTGPEYL